MMDSIARRLLAAASAAFACAALGAQLQAGELPEPIFSLGFEGTAIAKAKGNPEPLKQEAISFGEGVSGKALLAGPKTVLEYEAVGNLLQEQGTVSLWFKPEWDSSEFAAPSADKSLWHCLFSEPRPKKRLGSGALWLWLWGPSLRADISDEQDSYIIASSSMRKGEWHHFAFSWSAKERRLFIDGAELTVPSDSNSPLSPGNAGKCLANGFASFFVGGHNGQEQANGWIDEFKIYAEPLPAKAVMDEAAKFLPLKAQTSCEYLNAGEDASVECQIENRCKAPVSGLWAWRLLDQAGKEVAAKDGIQLDLKEGSNAKLQCQMKGLPAGSYKLEISAPGKNLRPLTCGLWALRKNALVKSSGKLDLKLLEELDLAKQLPPERFVSEGELKKGSLAGQAYLEAGAKEHDRFAVKAALPRAQAPYVIEWSYPDDKKRTMEVIAQPLKGGSDDYALQTGAFCGDEYPNSGKMLTQRCLYWAKDKDIAIIFMTARKDAPAAAASLRIYEVSGGLPDAQVKQAAPVSGWTRSMAVYYEDPAKGFDFGAASSLMPDYEDTVDRMAAYMKWTGQNMLIYPGVWYQGAIYPSKLGSYMPRLHPADYIACLLKKFEAEGLSFMPSINLHNLPASVARELDPGSFEKNPPHDSPAMIFKSGKPNPGGWHGTPPNFNPLHPKTQEIIRGYVDEMLDRYSGSPAFKGVVLHLTKHTIPWFGSIEAGYNDYNIDAFEKDTGIKVQADRKDPMRGKLYHDWLMANAKDQWIAWRCKALSRFYKELADRISARRPDLKLGIFSYHVTVSEIKDPRFGTPGFALAVDKESGFDPELYREASNIIAGQTIYPADYRWSSDRHYQKANPLGWETQRDAMAKKDSYAAIAGAPFPWVNMHDRYWEDSIGKEKPLKAAWLKEHIWRVSTLNPNQLQFARSFILPLLYEDVLGFSKGGFLIGTCGFEEQMAEFARAYRALPAVKFQELPCSTGTLKARALSTKDALWLYAVNASGEPATVSIPLEGAGDSVVELSSGAKATASGGSLKVDLKPWQLRSFKASPKAK